MKKPLLIIALMFVTCFVSAQQQHYNQINNGNRIGNPAQRQPTDKNNAIVPAKKHDFLNSKSLIWKWDTIVAYDTLDIKSQRHTRTFDINGNVLTELLGESWNTGTSTWENGGRNSYTYDGSGNLLTELEESWNTGTSTWVNIYRYTYTYDGSGNMLTELDEFWNSGTSSWRNYERLTYTYNGSNKILTELEESWNTGTSTWVNNSRYTYTYDGSGNLLTELSESWNTGTSTWVNSDRYTYTYNGSNKILTELVESWDTTSIWVNTYRDTYTYDGSGNMLSQSWDIWDGGTSTWWNYESFTYDSGGNVLTWLELGVYRYTYAYDGNGNKLTELEESWDAGTSTWVNHSKYTWTYDGNDNSVSEKREGWKNSNWQPALDEGYVYSKKNLVGHLGNIYRYEASFVSFINTGIENTLTGNNYLSIYPNPAQGNITIEISGTDNNTTASVYNLQGQMLLQQTLTVAKTEMDISSLPNGVYVIKLNTENGVAVKKFVKE